jgi:hypothetical protein
MELKVKNCSAVRLASVDGTSEQPNNEEEED